MLSNLRRITPTTPLVLNVPQSGKKIAYDLYYDENDNKEKVICDLCGHRSQVTGPPTNRSLSNLVRHRGLAGCQRNQRSHAAAAAREEQMRAQAAVDSLFTQGSSHFQHLETVHESESAVPTPSASPPPPDRAATPIARERPNTATSQNEVEERPETRSTSSPETPMSPDSLPGSDLANSLNLLDLSRGAETSEHGDESEGLAFVDMSSSSEDEGDGPEEPVQIPHAENSEDACRGQRIEWIAGSIWETYAYQQHGDPNISLPWTLHSIERGAKWVRLQARDCVFTLKTDEEKQLGSCKKCQRLANSKRVQKFMAQASVPDRDVKTKHSLLNAKQLRRLAKRLTKQVNSLKLEVCP